MWLHTSVNVLLMGVDRGRALLSHHGQQKKPPTVDFQATGSIKVKGLLPEKLKTDESETLMPLWLGLYSLKVRAGRERYLSILMQDGGRRRRRLGREGLCLTLFS